MVTRQRRLCALALLAVLATASGPTAGAATLRAFPITDQGAPGDGATLGTAAIQATIDRCAAAGGGVVVVPRGTFLTGALFLRQGVNLRIEAGGVLKGSDRLIDYLPPGATEDQRGVQPFALVNATGLTGTAVTGAGAIDGSGARWWAEYWKLRQAGDPDLAFKTRRPRLLHFTSCRNLRVADLELRNQAVWCVDLQFCDDVVAENLNIHAAHDAPSSDGMDVDSCRRVRISGCTFDVDDDDISIKAGKAGDLTRVGRPSEDITIERCHFAYGHGGVDVGSETFGGIRHVRLNDCVADSGNFAAIRFKTTPSRGGIVEDIEIRNLAIHNVRQAFEFNMDWHSGTSAPDRPGKVLPVVRDIRIIHVTGDAAAAGAIRGLEGSPVTGVTFTACAVTAGTGLILEHTRQIDLSGLALTVARGPAIISH
jgi:polygalacturonase